MLNYELLRRFQKNNHNFAIFALTFALLLCLSGCGIKSSRLRAVEDSAAIIQPTTGHEVYRHTEDRGKTFVRTINANIFIKYEPANDYTTEDVYKEIVAILEENNWKRYESNKDQTNNFRASSRQGSYPLSIRVSISSNQNLVTVRIENN